MSWLADFRRDIERYPRPAGGSATGVFLRNQGLWATLQYRAARAVDQSTLNPAVRRPLNLALGACQKAVELSTGITLPKTAEIGPGLCLLHGGRVVVHGGARVGERCTMAHNTTLGEHVRRGLRGSPNVGDDVYVGPNSGVYGPVCVGNGAAIGANAVVFREVPDGALVRCAESETVVRGEPALSSE